MIAPNHRPTASPDRALVRCAVPLLAQATALGVTAEQMHHLLSNLEMIKNFHAIFLAALQAPNARPELVVTQHFHFFKMYTAYTAAYPQCLATLSALQVKAQNRQASKFVNFLKNTDANLKKSGALDLLSYLIMPVQRIPRYSTYNRSVPF